MSEQPVSAAAVATALFQDNECWGWEYRETDLVRSPYSVQEPVRGTPAPPNSMSHSNDFRVISQLESARIFLFVCCALALIPGAILLFTPSSDEFSGSNRQGGAWLVVVGLGLGLIVSAVTVAGRRRLRHYQIKSAAGWAEWVKRCAEAQQEFDERWRRWREGLREHHRTERARVGSQSPWVPVVAGGGRGRVDVYGGTPLGWRSWLGVVCGSLVSGDVAVTVLDLSNTGAGAALAELAETAGVPCESITLPEGWDEVDLFAGRSGADVAYLLGEAVHAAEPDSTAAARGADARVLELVCGVLDRRLTIGRIAAALRVLLRQRPDTADQAVVLDPDTTDRVNGLLGETLRRQMEPRIATMEALLHPLEGLGATVNTTALAETTLPDRRRLLCVVTLADLVSDLAREVMTHLLVDVLRADLRSTAADTGERVLVVVGADRVPVKHLEPLGELGTQRGVRVVYLFQHVRGEVSELLGDADTVYLMRLGNGAEVTKAAELVGKEHRFVLHQRGSSTAHQDGTSDNVSRSFSMTQGATSGYGGGSTSTSLADQRTTGHGTTASVTNTESTGEQRVHEFTVDPATLQQLSDTAFVVVHGGNQQRRVRFGECNPLIAVDPVGYQPHPLHHLAP